jgi:hypothetical protein
MALATRPKPTVSHKKRRAQHHRHNKTYIKAYWPYLPMLAIVGAGVLANRFWPAGSFAGGNADAAFGQQLAAAQPLTRVQVMTGDQSGRILTTVILVTFTAFAVFLLRHSRRARRLVTEGEAFVSDHPLLDIACVFIITAGVVLTRITTG